MFNIVKIQDAQIVLQDGNRMGLEDVSNWITKEKLQHSLENNIFEAYNLIVENQSIGLIMVGYEEEDRVWIEILGVLDEYRRYGYGRKLIEHVSQITQIKQKRIMFVDVDKSNKIARKFYERVGFEKVGSMRKYYYDNTTAIVYAKEL